MIRSITSVVKQLISQCVRAVAQCCRRTKQCGDSAISSNATYRNAAGGLQGHESSRDPIENGGVSNATHAESETAWRFWLDAAQKAVREGKKDSALSALESGLEILPNKGEPFFRFGMLYFDLRCYEDAEYCFRMASTFEPQLTAALTGLGRVHYERNNMAEAQQVFEEVIRRDPAIVTGYEGLANVYLKRGDIATGIVHLEKVLPKVNGRTLLEVHNQIANLARENGMLQISEKHCHAALTIDPSNARALICLTYLSNANQEFDRANDIIDRVVAENPEMTLGYWVRAMLSLQSARFDRAWDDYERGMDLRLRKNRYGGRRTWNGERLTGKTILIFGEQGLGDEILFASCIPDVLKHAGQCIIECNAMLEKVFAASFPTAIVHGGHLGESRGWLSALPPPDFEVPIGSLPKFFRRALSDFSFHPGYLRVDAARVSRWKFRLDALGRGLKVGVSWRGGTYGTSRETRSIPLPDWLPVLQVPGVEFVNLQYGPSTRALSHLNQAHGIKIHHFADALDDYAETAGLVSALDLVISVCTSIVSLGGALGKPVWVLTPTSAGWMFVRGRNDMIWFPSARLFWQAKPGEWGPVVQNVAQALTKLAERRVVAEC